MKKTTLYMIAIAIVVIVHVVVARAESWNSSLSLEMTADEFSEAVTPLRNAHATLLTFHNEENTPFVTKKELDGICRALVKGLAIPAFPVEMRYYIIGSVASEKGVLSEQTLEELTNHFDCSKIKLPESIFSIFLAYKCYVESMKQPTMAPECICRMQSICTPPQVVLDGSLAAHYKAKYFAAQTAKASEISSACFSTIIPISGKDLVIEERLNFQIFSSSTRFYHRYWPDYRLRWDYIARQFETLGMFDEAWRAYIEAAYIMKHIGRMPSDQDYIRDRQNVLFCRAALCAHRAGEIRIAWQYLARIAVTGNKEIFETTMRIAKMWELGEKVTSADYEILALLPYQMEYLPPDYIPPCAPDQEASLDCIVKYYMRANVYPRALMLMDQHPKEFADVAKLRKEVEEDWRRHYEFFQGCIHARLYGHQVQTVGDPPNLTIPWAFPEDSLRCARERMFNLGVYWLFENK